MECRSLLSSSVPLNPTRSIVFRTRMAASPRDHLCPRFLEDGSRSRFSIYFWFGLYW